MDGHWERQPKDLDIDAALGSAIVGIELEDDKEGYGKDEVEDEEEGKGGKRKERTRHLFLQQRGDDVVHYSSADEEGMEWRLEERLVLD